jgi:hypothetical protein
VLPAHNAVHMHTHARAAFVQKVNVVDNTGAQRFRRAARHRAHNAGPLQRIKGGGLGTPDVGRTQQTRRKDKDGPLAGVVGDGDPNVVDHAQHQNGPQQESAGLGRGLVKLVGEAVKGRCQTANGVVGQKRKSADGPERNMLLPGCPA